MSRSDRRDWQYTVEPYEGRLTLVRTAWPSGLRFSEVVASVHNDEVHINNNPQGGPQFAPVTALAELLRRAKHQERRGLEPPTVEELEQARMG